MIPKIIHYCWFGKGEKPKLAIKCIESWKKHCPDYEIIEWNEENFDINLNNYTKKCYREKKYAFLSDFVRLWVVNSHGGIYLDTDVEIIRSFDSLLNHSAFFGFESNDFVNTGLGFGAEKGNILVEKCLKEYDSLLDGKSDYISCPKLNTQALVGCGLELNGQKQDLEQGIVYPEDYFDPYDDAIGKVNKTENTFSIHWYSKSWFPKRKLLRNKITRILHRLFGVDFKQKLMKILNCKSDMQGKK